MCSPDIIIEGLAEGGVTRMLWLYSDVNEIPKVGSIRSARMDFLEMAEGFDAIFVHCGQSQTAAAAINARHIDTINGGVWLGKYLKRDEQRLREVSSEHTVYTTGKMLGKCLSEQNYRTEKRKDTTTSSPSTQRVTPKDTTAAYAHHCVSLIQAVTRTLLNTENQTENTTTT